MKTEVIMKREIFGREIRQKSKSGYFSSTDLVNAGNKWRIENNLPIFNLSQFLEKESTKEFINQLKRELNEEEIVIKGRGRNSCTWVHPYLFIDIALSINPKLKVSVYKWLYDRLLEYRNKSGDSYKKMSGALFINSKNKQNFVKEIGEIANKIKEVCGVDDWQKANEKQLAYRDRLHENISLLSGITSSNEKAVELAIQKTEKEIY